MTVPARRRISNRLIIIDPVFMTSSFLRSKADDHFMRCPLFRKKPRTVEKNYMWNCHVLCERSTPNPHPDARPGQLPHKHRSPLGGFNSKTATFGRWLPYERPFVKCRTVYCTRPQNNRLVDETIGVQVIKGTGLTATAGHSRDRSTSQTFGHGRPPTHQLPNTHRHQISDKEPTSCGHPYIHDNCHTKLMIMITVERVFSPVVSY